MMNPHDLYNGRSNRRGNRILLAALAIALHPDATEEEKQEIARKVLCDFCRSGVHREGEFHIVGGVNIPCDAETKGEQP